MNSLWITFLIRFFFSANDINKVLLDLYTEDTEIELEAVIEVLLKHQKHAKRETRIAVLRWLKHIHTKASSKVITFD